MQKNEELIVENFVKDVVQNVRNRVLDNIVGESDELLRHRSFCTEENRRALRNLVIEVADEAVMRFLEKFGVFGGYDIYRVSELSMERLDEKGVFALDIDVPIKYWSLISDSVKYSRKDIDLEFFESQHGKFAASDDPEDKERAEFIKSVCDSWE